MLGLPPISILNHSTALGVPAFETERMSCAGIRLEVMIRYFSFRDWRVSRVRPYPIGFDWWGGFVARSMSLSTATGNCIPGGFARLGQSNSVLA